MHLIGLQSHFAILCRNPILRRPISVHVYMSAFFCTCVYHMSRCVALAAIRFTTRLVNSGATQVHAVLWKVLLDAYSPGRISASTTLETDPDFKA